MVYFEQIKMEQTWLLRNFKRNIIILKMVANYVSYQNYFKSINGRYLTLKHVKELNMFIIS